MTMKAADVTDTLELALEASVCNNATVIQKPRPLSDSGASYVASDLAVCLEDKGMDHVRGAPHHPQIQGKIPLVTLPRNALPASGQPERQIGAFSYHPKRICQIQGRRFCAGNFRKGDLAVRILRRAVTS